MSNEEALAELRLEQTYLYRLLTGYCVGMMNPRTHPIVKKYLALIEEVEEKIKKIEGDICE